MTTFVSSLLALTIYCLFCSLSDKLEIKTQESRRISKEFEGAVAVQDAGMQTLEVCLLLDLIHYPAWSQSSSLLCTTFHDVHHCNGK